MKRILIINGKETISIEIPLFGKVRWKKIKHEKLKGKSYDLIYTDEIMAATAKEYAELVDEDVYRRLIGK